MLTLLVFLATLTLTIVLYIVIPKGFFPVQDTGVIQGISQAPASTSFTAMAERQQALARRDPARSGGREPVVVHRRRRHQHDDEQRAVLDQPEAAGGARRVRRTWSVGFARPSRARFTASTLFTAAGPEHHRPGPRRAARCISTRSRTRIPRRSRRATAAGRSHGSPRLPELEDVGTDQQPGGLARQRRYRSRERVAPRAVGLADRQHALRRVRAAPDRHLVHAVEPVPRDPRGRARSCRRGRCASQTSTCKVRPRRRPARRVSRRRGIGREPVGPDDRERIDDPRAVHADAIERRARPDCRTRSRVARDAAGAAELAARRRRAAGVDRDVHDDDASARDHASGTVPGGHDLVRPRAERLARHGDREHRGCWSRSCVPGEHAGRRSRAPPPRSSTRCRTSRCSSSRRCITVYIVLGVLYESFVHPLTILSTLPSAGVGALLALMLFGQDLDVVSIIGIILLIGIVKKNGILMVDFALEAERTHGKSAERGDLRGGAAPVPPDPDDHARRAARRPSARARQRLRRGAAPSAGHRDGRRSARQPDPHALHDARDLRAVRSDPSARER